MALDSLLPLGAFAMASTLSPGGATTLATASGAHFGYRRSLPLIVGITFALAAMAAVAAAGLASLLLTAPALTLAMKVAGAAYLLWLAWKIATSGSPHASANPRTPMSFLGGVWLQSQNPKGWAMTLGAAASFAALSRSPFVLAAWLGLAFGVAAAVSLTAWCLAGSVLAKALKTDRQWRVLNGLLAALLVLSILPMLWPR